jgi:hypothetical protein
MMEKKTYIGDILEGQAAILELILAGVLLALSIEFIASACLSLLAIPAVWILIVGVLLCVIAFLLLFRRFTRHTRTRVATLRGFIVYLPKENDVAYIPRYGYGSSLHEYLHAVFVENPALKVLWDKEPLTAALTLDQSKGTVTLKQTQSIRLIQEATEYFLLSQLSTHLVDYFNDDDYEQGKLREYAREDVPDILMQNRFLDLFSRPMDQRSEFVNDTIDPNSSRGVVASYGKGGVIYERFDLVLPHGSSVSRSAPGTIQIETPSLVLSLRVEFQCASTVPPLGFEEFYLGLKDLHSFHEYQITIQSHVTFKGRAYLSSSGWDYHKWVDSFLDSLEVEFSEERFLKELNWPTALTLIDIFKRNQSNQASEATSGPALSAASSAPQG